MCTSIQYPVYCLVEIKRNNESLNYSFILSYSCFFVLLSIINKKHKHCSNGKEFESYCFEKSIKNKGKLQLNSHNVLNAIFKQTKNKTEITVNVLHLFENHKIVLVFLVAMELQNFEYTIADVCTMECCTQNILRTCLKCL